MMAEYIIKIHMKNGVVLSTVVEGVEQLPPKDDTEWFWVDTAQLNIRKTPNTVYAPINYFAYGEIVRAKRTGIFASGNNWLEIIGGEFNGKYIAELVEQLDAEPRLIPVPYISQLTPDAPAGPDCGHACVLMFLRHYFPAQFSSLSVNDVYRQKQGRTSASDLKSLLDHFTSYESVDYDLGINTKQIQLVQPSTEYPAIVLGDYKKLDLPSHLAGGSDQGLHWVVITGILGDTVFFHDPLWTPSQRKGLGGAHVPVLLDVFNHALHVHSLNCVV